jgi:hypothetical protein
MHWTLNVELTHKDWLQPIHKTLYFEGDLDRVLAKIKEDMQGKTRDSDLWNLKHNRSTSFRDINNVTHRWRLQEDGPTAA